MPKVFSLFKIIHFMILLLQKIHIYTRKKKFAYNLLTARNESFFLRAPYSKILEKENT